MLHSRDTSHSARDGAGSLVLSCLGRLAWFGRAIFRANRVEWFLQLLAYRRSRLPMNVRVLLVVLLCPWLVHCAHIEKKQELYLGADLSYANELEDCGGVVREQGKPRDPFELL